MSDLNIRMEIGSGSLYYDVVGAGRAHDILAMIAGVDSHRSRVWPAPANLNFEP